MIYFFIILFFTIGLIVSVFHICTFGFSMSEKLRESREHKQAHEKRLVTLLEAIKQKLDSRL